MVDFGSALGFSKSADQDAAERANAAKVEQDKQAAIALENYRQNARDQYHTLLTQRMAPYQAYSNRLAAAYGQGMSTAGLAPNENPLTLQDTGVGAPQGSNYAGWDETKWHPGMQGKSMGSVTHHAGIGEELAGPVKTGQTGATGSDPNRVDTVDYMNGAVDPRVLAAQNPANNSTYNPGQAALPQGGGQPAPSQYNFMPRRAP
jgi:hypothetical protein